MNNKCKNKKSRLFLGCGCGIILIIFIAFYTIRLLLTEGLESKRWSYAYFVTISSKTIRRIPIVRPVESATFNSRPSDGPAPAMQEVSYKSFEKKEVLDHLIGNYLESLGYQRSKEEANFLECVYRKSEKIACEYGIDQENNISCVHVMEIYY